MTPSWSFEAGDGIVTLSGPGVHSGNPGKVTLDRPPGIVASHIEIKGWEAPLTLEGMASFSRRADYSTIIGHAGGELRMVEHLLAVLCLCPLPVRVRIEGSELPILDGSGLPWLQALRQLDMDNKAPVAPRFRDCGLHFDFSEGGTSLRAEPWHRFEALCLVDTGHWRQKALLIEGGDGWEELLSARTFMDGARFEEIRQGSHTLLQGAGRDSGMLLASTPADYARLAARLGNEAGPFPLLHPTHWRMPEEAAWHKMLDLLGDLALAGPMLPRLRIHVVNGGHWLHHRFLERLIP